MQSVNVKLSIFTVFDCLSAHLQKIKKPSPPPPQKKKINKLFCKCQIVVSNNKLVICGHGSVFTGVWSLENIVASRFI